MTRPRPIIAGNASPGTGGYTPALRAGDFVYVSGQGPLDPQTLDVLGETVAEQTEHTLQNVLALVEAAGGDAGSIVRCTCYLASIDSFDEFTAAYERFFSAHPRPTRTTIGCQLAGILVEIDCVAYIPDARQWLTAAAVEDWLAAHRDDLVDLVRELVSHPSENRPPRGEEAACQEFVAGHLRDLGLEPGRVLPGRGSGGDRAPRLVAGPRLCRAAQRRSPGWRGRGAAARCSSPAMSMWCRPSARGATPTGAASSRTAVSTAAAAST